MNRRRFLKSSAGLFVPAAFGVAKADVVWAPWTLNNAAAGGAGNHLLNSLTAVYEMEQGNNANATDATGNGKTLTVSGSTTQSTTHIQGSFAGHGSPSSSWSINDAAFNTTGSFSWYGWVNTPSDGDFIVDRWGTGHSWALYFDGSGAFPGGTNHYKLVIRNTADSGNFIASSTITVSGAGWHMAFITWDSAGTIGKISVDNESLVSTGATNALRSVSDNWQLGLAATIIDENAWWGGRILTQTDATTLYASGSGFFYNNNGGNWTT